MQELIRGLVVHFCIFWADTEWVRIGEGIVVIARNSETKHEFMEHAFHAHRMYISICLEQEAGHLFDAYS